MALDTDYDNERLKIYRALIYSSSEKYLWL